MISPVLIRALVDGERRTIGFLYSPGEPIPPATVRCEVWGQPISLAPVEVAVVRGQAEARL